ncbi:MAG: hypothetical protein ACKVT0_14600 [Planctomycetaceae bacterium]
MNVLNNQIFWRLMWKEYRSQRALWLGIVGIALFLQVVILCVLKDQRALINGLFITAWSLSSLYALSSCAVLFAAEKEDGTYDLLRSLPTTPLRMFAGKMCFCVVTSAGMVGVLNALAWGMSREIALKFPISQQLQRQHAEFFALTLAIGLFFSLKLNRVLNVIIATVVLALVLNTNNMPWLKYGGFVTFLLADVWLVRRWFLDESSISDRVGGLIRRFPFAISWRSRSSSLRWARTETASPWWRAWKRTLWLEWRQVWPVLLIWLPVAIALISCSTLSYQYVGYRFATPVLIVAPLFLGVASFRPHQIDRRIQFATTFGIPPQLVWLSCQIVWGVATAFFVAILVSPFIIELFLNLGLNRNFAVRYYYSNADAACRLLAQFFDTPTYRFTFDESHYGNRADSQAFYLWYAAICYVAGQLCSLKFSKTVIATFMGLILSGLGYVWLSIMARLPVPYWLCAAPIVMFWLLVSFIGLRRWSVEGSTWRTKLRTTGLLIAFHACHLGAICIFRINEVPSEYWVDEWIKSSSEQYANITGVAVDNAQQTTTDPYTNAARLVTTMPMHVKDGWKKYKYTAEGWDRAYDDWEEENRLPVTMLVEALKTDALPDPSRFTHEDAWACFGILIFSANRLTRAGELDQALDRFDAISTFIKRAALAYKFEPYTGSMPSFQGRLQWVIRTRGILPDLITWASHEQQTPERLRRAIEMLEPHRLSPKLVQQCWDAASAQNRWLLENDMEQLDANTALLCLLPWEKTRRIRLLDREAYHFRSPVTAHRNSDIERERSIHWPELDRSEYWAHRVQGFHMIDVNEMPASYHLYDLHPRHSDRATYNQALELQRTSALILSRMINAEMEYRATRLRLELMAQRLETGVLPRRLRETLTTLDQVDLIDPWCEQKFSYFPDGETNGSRLSPAGAVEPGEPFVYAPRVLNNLLRRKDRSYPHFHNGKFFIPLKK